MFWSVKYKTFTAGKCSFVEKTVTNGAANSQNE